MSKRVTISALCVAALVFTVAWGQQEKEMEKKDYRELTPEEAEVIVGKGTELPFTGEYDDHYQSGTYHCRRCDAPLYRSADKFKSGCGWPSFDDEIDGAVRRETDADGVRTEILCANCGAHLGHVFEGEQMTDKNVRHCVNSISMVFVPDSKASDSKAESSTDEADVGLPQTARAHFAGGCFWGMEHMFQKKDGVVSVVSGYMGGTKDEPTYQDVLTRETGHLEAIEVEYDPTKVSYEELTRYFFEIHDPTQANGQGPDIGAQYLSAVFYGSDEEKETAEKLIALLEEKGYDVATMVRRTGTFWRAEDYHQDYYEKKGQSPYCHAYTKRF